MKNSGYANLVAYGFSFALLLSQNENFLKHIGKKNNEIVVLRDVAALLKTTCLVHDIGNPPFGHFGENVIQDCYKQLFESLRYEIKEANGETTNYNHPILKFASLANENEKYLKELTDFLREDNKALLDYTEFDGNAQGFRILTKLQYQGDLTGLNLTLATLAASLKYPNTSKKQKHLTDNGSPLPEDQIALHKHGVFTTEQDYLDKISLDCGLINKDVIKRHPLSFLMEAADSICYLIMDIEDGISKGWFTLNNVIDLLGKIDTNDFKQRMIDENIRSLDKSKNLRWCIIKLRNFLFDYLISKAVDNFVKNIKAIEDGDYQHELIFDDDNKLAESLQSFSRDEILSQREIVSLEVTGRAVISGLFKIYIDLLFHQDKGFRDRGKSLISRAIFKTTLHEHLQSKGLKDNEFDIEYEYQRFDVKDFSVEERLRIIRDFISGMTDNFALNHYRKLSGQQIS